MTKYAQYQKICDTIFAIFIVIWLVTRLGMYPRIIYSSSYEATKILPMFPAYYIFNSLLLLLLVLHIGWTYLIFQIAVQALRAGQVIFVLFWSFWLFSLKVFYALQMDGDVRSSSDEISDSSVDNVSSQKANGEPVAQNGTPKKLRAEENGNAKSSPSQSDNTTQVTTQ